MAIDVTVSGLNTVVDVEFAESPSDIPPETYIALRGEKGDKGDKGDTGATGAAAGFGTVTATVDSNVGTPSVTVTASGSNTAKNFAFAFSNMKGEQGDQGDQGETGNGIADISLTSTAANVDTYTITYDDGTTETFNVTNGIDGQDGADGYSPSASVSKSGNAATITITDEDGTTTTDVYDGAGVQLIVWS